MESIYLADSLPKNFPLFFSSFSKILEEEKINYQLLPNTKDIWCRDFMPIQVNENKMVQFIYNPDYLRKYKKWRKTISDVNIICETIQISPLKEEIVLDGGNVIRFKNKVIMCDKVFEENKNIPKKNLKLMLENIFEAEEIIFIPAEPKDICGHADGMIRFVDEKTVLINQYSKEDEKIKLELQNVLRKANLNWIEIPYNPYQNNNWIQANGIYLNYFQTDGKIFLPIYQLKEDDEAIKLFEKIFSGQKIIGVDSREIANEGGVLNCITWEMQNYHLMNTETINQEKTQLDLIEKKVEIQKKILEIKKEKVNLQNLKQKKFSAEEEQVLVNKVAELRYLLDNVTIDEERTILGSEPFLKPIITGEEREIVKAKIIELLKKF